jgi:chromosome segregation ATPase
MYESENKDDPTYAEYRGYSNPEAVAIGAETIVTRNPSYAVGWKLHSIEPCEEIVWLEEQKAKPSYSGNVEFEIVSRKQSLRKTMRFVLVREKDAAFAELSKNLKESLRQIETLTSERDEALGKVKHVCAGHNNLKSELASEKLALDTVTENYGKLNKLLQAYEQDLGKIRKELGDAKLREIVGH